jgi:hypothetical protein
MWPMGVSSHILEPWGGSKQLVPYQSHVSHGWAYWDSLQQAIASLFCAKYLFLIENALLNIWLQSYWELRKQRKIALSSWYPELWAMLMGVVWAQKKCKGSRIAPSVVSKQQPEQRDTLQVSWVVSEAISGLNTLTMWLFICTSCLQRSSATINWRLFLLFKRVPLYLKTSLTFW